MMSVNPAKPTPLEDKFILTSEEAAEFLGVSLRTIRYWVATRRIPYFHLGRFIRFKPADLTAFWSPGGSSPWSTDGPCRASATHGPGGGGAEWPLRRGDEFPCHDEHLGRFGGSPRVVGVPDSRITTVDRRRPRRPSPRRLRPDVGCLAPSQRWNGGSLSIPRSAKNCCRTTRHCGCPHGWSVDDRYRLARSSCTDGNYVSTSSPPWGNSVTPPGDN